MPPEHTAREVDRDPRPPDCGFRAEFIGSHQNSRARLGGLAQLVALERADLLPVEFQHPVRQLRDRYTQDVVRMLGHVLDAVLDQRHQRGELVRRGPQARLEDRHHALPEEQRVSAG